MKSTKKILIFVLIITSAVLITLSVIFYNQGESSEFYSIFPPLGCIGIIAGAAAIVLIIVAAKKSSDDYTSAVTNHDYAETIVDLDPKYLEKLEKKETFNLSVGYTDGKENKCIEAMEKFGWKLVRKNEYNLTLYFERETESIEIERMLLPIAIRINNNDNSFLKERAEHIYASIELAKRLYNQYPSEGDAARYAGTLLASAIATKDFPFKDLYEEALEEVRTRVEIEPENTYDTYSSDSSNSYSSDDSDSSHESSVENEKEDNGTEIEDYHRIFDSSWSIIGFYRNGFVLDTSYNVIGEYRNGFVERYGSNYGEYNSSGYMFRYSQKIGRCQDGTIYDEYDHMIGKYDGNTDGACAAAMLIIF